MHYLVKLSEYWTYTSIHKKVYLIQESQLQLVQNRHNKIFKTVTTYYNLDYSDYYDHKFYQPILSRACSPAMVEQGLSQWEKTLDM